MTSLHDRLVDLADETDPDVRATPPQELWRSGRRRGRRRRTVTALVSVAAVLAVAGGVGAVADRLAARTPLPVTSAPGDEPSPAVPDRVFDASSWLPRAPVAGGGALVAAVYEAQRTVWSGGSVTDLVAVSAVDQSYRWLDLPDFDKPPNVSSDHWSLSPSGTYLAYWSAPEGGGLMLSVVDLREQHLQGLLFEEQDAYASSIGWVGDQIWVCPSDPCEAFERIDASSMATTRIEVGPGRSGSAATYVPGPGGTSTLTLSDGGPTEIFSLGVGGSARTPVTSVSGSVDGVASSIDSAALSTGGDRVAVVRLGEVRVGDVVPQGETPTVALPGDDDVVAIRGWLDDDTLLATVSEQGLVRIDPTTGERTPVVAFPEAVSPEIAVDLSGAVTTGVAPPEPRDPRILAGSGAAGATILLAAALWVRGRRELR